MTVTQNRFKKCQDVIVHMTHPTSNIRVLSATSSLLALLVSLKVYQSLQLVKILSVDDQNLKRLN